jgi:hypothetical protein
MRRIAVAFALLLLTACSGTTSPFTDSCLATIKYHGKGYTEAGFSSRDLEPTGKATIATCAVSSEDGQVEVFASPDFDADEVVAVQQGDDTFRVFVADGLGEDFINSVMESGLTNAGDM